MDTPPSPETTSRNISEAAAAALEAQGLSSRKAAELTGIALTTLNRRLSGATPFKVDELAVVANVAGTTVTALVEGRAA